jgi:CHAT domain
MADGGDAADAIWNRARNPSSGALRRLSPRRPVERKLPAARARRADDRTEMRLPGIDAGVQQKLPHGVAELIVYRRDSTVGERGFGLRAASCCSEIRDIGDSGRSYRGPELYLSTQTAPGDTPAARFLQTMHAWSAGQSSLIHWLDKCRHRHDALELLVWDDTGLRIPWELLWLPAALGDGQPGAEYLGGAVTVTRWTTMRPRFQPLVRSFPDFMPDRASGAVAAYIAETMAGHAALFDEFVVEHAEDMADLFRILSAATSRPLAMVYVASHGQFADDTQDSALGGYPLGSTFRYDLSRLREQAALVFLNGCHSRSADMDARMFLQSGAAGVLVTTGAVDNDDAPALVGDLLRRIRETPELSVAEAVRQLRASAAADIAELLRTNRLKGKQVAADRTLFRRLLNPFMYAYYGNPRILLSLEERGGPAAAEFAWTGA